jgi:hypothetical protein
VAYYIGELKIFLNTVWTSHCLFVRLVAVAFGRILRSFVFEEALSVCTGTFRICPLRTFRVGPPYLPHRTCVRSSTLYYYVAPGLIRSVVARCQFPLPITDSCATLPIHLVVCSIYLSSSLFTIHHCLLTRYCLCEPLLPNVCSSGGAAQLAGLYVSKT